MLELSFKGGDILKSDMSLIINPVNVKGISGAGLALQFKKKYPKNYESYKTYCKGISSFDEYKSHATIIDAKHIFNFASKDEPQYLSKLQYIRRSLIYLVNYIESNKITSIAIPPVGCGLGGLLDEQVLHLILYHLRQVPFDLEVELYKFKVRPMVKEQFLRWYDRDYRNMDSYVGVGSRELTKEGRLVLYDVAMALSDEGYSLSTGDATQGCDDAFWEMALPGHRVRYGPFGKTKYLPETRVIPNDSVIYDRANSIAGVCHPTYRWLPDWMKELHLRNVFQVLGGNLDSPREFLVCWTPDGAETTKETSKKTGGTGTAIRVANMFGVPVFNLKRDDAVIRLQAYLRTNIKRVYRPE